MQQSHTLNPFNNPLPVALAILPVIRNNQTYVLAIRRQDNDKIALPGGYVKPYEDVGKAACRELKEECGRILSKGKPDGGKIRPKPLRVFSTAITPENRLLLFLAFEALPFETMPYLSLYLQRKKSDGSLFSNREVGEFLLVGRENLKDFEGCFFDNHGKVIADFLNQL